MATSAVAVQRLWQDNCCDVTGNALPGKLGDLPYNVVYKLTVSIHRFACLISGWLRQQCLPSAKMKDKSFPTSGSTNRD